ncbi:hypothetical protein NDU88_008567 [Pleurodeles waltl]|uniref:Uncharacterized protein n=1 Tax=Pleurodeles waltl TaxID=8319 RepID=A0AAV7N5D0_PLEWA|nr:hypothetical protein NDU88_008567 [Pleurodeles waltl]
MHRTVDNALQARGQSFTRGALQSEFPGVGASMEGGGVPAAPLLPQPGTVPPSRAPSVPLLCADAASVRSIHRSEPGATIPAPEHPPRSRAGPLRRRASASRPGPLQRRLSSSLGPRWPIHLLMGCYYFRCPIRGPPPRQLRAPLRPTGAPGAAPALRAAQRSSGRG